MSRTTPEVPSASWKYTKFEDKVAVKLRVLWNPIVGRVDWDKRWDKPKPVRTKERQAPLNVGDEKNQPKQFWALAVYNYNDKKVQVWEITQITIMRAIETLAEDEDFGDPTLYDIKVTKKKVGDKTEYNVAGLAKSDLSEEAMEIINTTPCNLDALYDWGDPFEVQDEKF